MSLVLLDTNIVIYCFDPADVVSADFVGARPVCVSVITRIEALGSSKSNADVARSLRVFLDNAPTFDLDHEIVEQTINLRRRRSVKLGDAIIAATAIVHGLTLATRNVKDFTWIEELAVVNPYDEA